MQIISQGQVSPNKNVSNQDVNLITQERYSRVPEDLKSKNLWCCYSLSENKNDATKKPSKIPKNPQTGQNAKVNDTTTLTDFETAKQAVLSNRYDGLNFAFGQDSELVGIDVDNVLDKDGGFINHSAAAIFDKFKSDGAYIETSPSGTGLRIICRRSDKIFLQFGKGKKFRDFEIYGFEMRRETTMPKLASGLHFLSISGDTLNTSDNLPVCDSVLEDFCRSYIWKSINLDDGSFKSEKKEVEKSDFEESPELSDDKIIEKLRSSKRSVDFDFLFDVGVGSGDNSADDLTLCSMIAFYTQDAAQIENIFNESALVRDKWLDRKNYRDSTIKKAIEGLTTTWQPKINDEGYDWQDKLLENVDEFNKEYANVVIGSKQRIMREFTDGMLEFYQTRDMRDLFANTSIQVGTEGGDEDGSPIYKDKFTAWFKHYESRTYRGGVIFKPAQKVNSDQYNLWKGFMVEPKLGDCSLIKKHIKDVVCSGDEVVSEYLFNWIAYSFQRPEIPIGVAVVLRGEKGCGKGTLGHFLSKIWGIHAFHISNPAHLVGNFNGL
jgi:primase-polymerase (primpol)-like protein